MHARGPHAARTRSTHPPPPPPQGIRATTKPPSRPLRPRIFGASFFLTSFSSLQGGATQTPGVLVGPLSPLVSAIKCHQKSTCNSAGPSVGSFAPPSRAIPRLGGAVVSCQYLPCSFVLALRAPGLRLGFKAPLPLRASSRGVPPWAPNALYVSSAFYPRGSRFVFRGSCLQNETNRDTVTAGVVLL
jgi:hypothetical protein